MRTTPSLGRAWCAASCAGWSSPPGHHIARAAHNRTLSGTETPTGASAAWQSRPSVPTSGSSPIGRRAERRLARVQHRGAHRRGLQRGQAARQAACPSRPALRLRYSPAPEEGMPRKAETVESLTFIRTNQRLEQRIPWTAFRFTMIPSQYWKQCARVCGSPTSGVS